MPSASLQQAAAQALSAVQRAQALFGSNPEAPTASEPSLGSAVQPLAAAGQRASVLSGVMVDNHRSFVDATTQVLRGDDSSDKGLYQALGRAAVVTQRGRSELDAIVARTRSLAAAAYTTRGPAGGRALLAALREQVSKANAVVDAAHRQASGIAGQIRALDYRSGGGTRPADNPHFKQGGGPDGGPSIDDPFSDPQLEDQGNNPYDLGATFPDDDGKGLIITGDPETGRPMIIDPKTGQVIQNPFPVGDVPDPQNWRPLVTGTAVGPDGHKWAFYSLKKYGSDQTPGAFIGDSSHVQDLSNRGVDLGGLADTNKVPIGQASGVYDPANHRMYIVGNPNGTGPRTLYSAPYDPAHPNGWMGTLTQVNSFPPGQGGAPSLAGVRENQIVALPGGKGFMMVGAENGQPITAAVASTPEGLLNAPAKVVSPGTLVPQGTDGGTPYGPSIVSITPTPDGQLQVKMRMSVWPDPPGWAAAHPPGDTTPKPYHPRTYTNTFNVNP
jgi:hypothetical protein